MISKDYTFTSKVPINETYVGKTVRASGLNYVCMA